MKKFIIAFIVLSVSLSGFAKEASPVGHMSGISVFHNEMTILANYFKIKEALAADDAAAASAAATVLVESAQKVTSDHYAKEVQDSLKLQLPIIIENATLIANSKDIKEQRKSFIPLSNAFRVLVASGKISKTPVYEQYCPMKKAYWLSTEEAVKNPYYGSSMLTCGRVTKTF